MFLLLPETPRIGRLLEHDPRLLLPGPGEPVRELDRESLYANGAKGGFRVDELPLEPSIGSGGGRGRARLPLFPRPK